MQRMAVPEAASTCGGVRRPWAKNACVPARRFHIIGETAMGGVGCWELTEQIVDGVDDMRLESETARLRWLRRRPSTRSTTRRGSRAKPRTEGIVDEIDDQARLDSETAG